MQETIEKLGERGEIVNKQADQEFQLAELRRMIGIVQAEVNTWRVHPTRYNNLQVEYLGQLQQFRSYEAETVGNIEDLKRQWRQLNEQEIERALQHGDNVKPLDRVGLINRLQASRQKYLDSYRDARVALAEKSDQPAVRTQELNKAIGRLKSAGDAKQLASSEAFMAEFVSYCGGYRFFSNFQTEGADVQTEIANLKLSKRCEPRHVINRRLAPYSQKCPKLV